MGVEEGQGGQWTPRGEPKGAPEGPRRPNWEPQGPKWWAKGSKWWAKEPKRVPKGSHKTTKRKPKGTYERKREHLKNIEKLKENKGFLRIYGV